ncbi:unnamed protein product [Ectocarpus sp. 12 AP-2014]
MIWAYLGRGIAAAAWRDPSSATTAGALVSLFVARCEHHTSNTLPTLNLLNPLFREVRVKQVQYVERVTCRLPELENVQLHSPYSRAPKQPWARHHPTWRAGHTEACYLPTTKALHD